MNGEEHRANISRRKNRVVFDWQDLVTDAEALLRSTAAYTGEEIEDARARLKRQLDSVRGHAGHWNRQAMDSCRAVSGAADEYVHDHPWKLLGVVAVLGVMAGLCVGNDKRRQ